MNQYFDLRSWLPPAQPIRPEFVENYLGTGMPGPSTVDPGGGILSPFGPAGWNVWGAESPGNAWGTPPPETDPLRMEYIRSMAPTNDWNDQANAEQGYVYMGNRRGFGGMGPGMLGRMAMRPPRQVRVERQQPVRPPVAPPAPPPVQPPVEPPPPPAPPPPQYIRTTHKKAY